MKNKTVIRVRRRSAGRTGWLRMIHPAWFATAGILLLAASAVLIFIFFKPGSTGFFTGREYRVNAADMYRQSKTRLKISIFPSENEEWSAGEAEYLAERMSEFRYISPLVASAEDAPPESDLTVYIGYSETAGESYLEAYRRLGSDGIEIGYSENSDGKITGVNILAFSEKRAHEGTVRFADYFLSENRLKTVFSKFSLSESGGDTLESFETLPLSESGYRLAVFSHPDSGTYTLRALGAIADAVDPDAILFNGGLCIGSDRDSVSSAWMDISSAVTGKSPEWGVNPTVEDVSLGDAFELTHDVLRSVVSGNGKEGTAGLLLSFESRRSVGGIILIGSDGKPAGIVYVISGDAENDPDGVCEIINRVSGVLEKAAGAKVGGAAILPSVPEDFASYLSSDHAVSGGVPLYSNIVQYVTPAADKLFDAATGAGIGTAVVFGGFNNVGVIGYGNASVALCGSIGFSNPGIGGQFALNNSRRGGILLSFDGNGVMSPSLLLASDYGMNQKNAG